MIVVDTSALLSFLIGEPGADAIMQTIVEAEAICMSAGTLAEAMIVADRRLIGEDMKQLIDGLGIEVVSVTPARAVAVHASYQSWGKGIHPAGLNFGDCFAYALARERDCPLLFVGQDFSKTDVKAALASTGAASD